MKKDEIRNLTVFSALTDEDFDTLFNISYVKEFSSGQIIHYEGDEAEDVYFLLSGFTKIYKVDRFDNEVFLFPIKQPGIISTFFFFENSHYFANAECLYKSLILIINNKKLQEVVKNNFNIFKFFSFELMKKIKIFQYVVDRETIYDGTAKVAYMLANSLEEFNSLKKQEVAYMLNIQPETLSRILTKLKREDLIETQSDGNVIVKNITKLSNIYK